MSKFFTINIGSNGSILLLNSNKSILDKIYCKDINDVEIKNKIIDLFKKNSKIPVYLILDNVGQNYNKKSFPNVSYFDLFRIVKRKFNIEIPKDDLKEKRFIGKNKENNNFEYMFISSTIDEIINFWLDLIDNIDNVLAGIYMLPLEVENILKKIKKKLQIKNNQNFWDIVIIENEVCGFREITFMNGKLIFTRILNENTIDQNNFNNQFNDNMLRNVDYLKRFYSNFSQNNLNVYTITNSYVKNLINNLNTKKDFKIKSFSYEEFASIFDLNKKFKDNLNYGDLLFGELIIKNKNIISFSTKNMKQLVLLSLFNNIFLKLIFALLVFFIFSTIFLFYSLTKYNIILDRVNNEYNKQTVLLKQKKEKEFGNGVLNIDEIVDVTSFYLEINKFGVNPFELILKFASLFNNNELIVNSLEWKINNLLKENISKNNKKILYIECIIINQSGKIDDLFKIYDKINSILKSGLQNYTITTSDLPKNINFNTSYLTFPIKITIVEN